MKFIATDVWTFLFGKAATKIDNKEENIHIIYDSDFKFLRRIVPENDAGRDYVHFCGSFINNLLKSLFQAFSIETDIVSESHNHVEYAFTISIKSSNQNL